jgi:hypothetical protein
MRRGADPGRLPRMEGAQLLGGRYALLDQIGAGGMAMVWRARDEVLGRTVAVKLLAGRHAGEPDARDRIRAEARAAAMLSHPNIAQVYDYGEAREYGVPVPYVVMELVRGGTLQDRMDAGPMSPRFAMRMAAEVAAALAAAHADGLVHRDIKPANVMVTDTGAKVVDFGIAAAINPGGTGDEEFEVLGTPAYLAPERLIGDGVEPASDVYALGVLLYRMLSGLSPWSADTTTQMLTAHVYIDPVPLPDAPGVPDYVTALCNRCLSKDPTQRPSAREAAALLAQGAGLRVVEDAVPEGPASSGHDHEPSVLIRPRSAGVTGAAAAGVAGAAAGVAGAAAAGAAAAGGLTEPGPVRPAAFGQQPDVGRQADFGQQSDFGPQADFGQQPDPFGSARDSGDFRSSGAVAAAGPGAVVPRPAAFDSGMAAGHGAAGHRAPEDAAAFGSGVAGARGAAGASAPDGHGHGSAVSDGQGHGSAVSDGHGNDPTVAGASGSAAAGARQDGSSGDRGRGAPGSGAAASGAAASGAAASGAAASGAAGTNAAAKRRRRRFLPVFTAVLLIAIIGLLWWLISPDGDRAGQSAAGPKSSGDAPSAGASSAGAPSAAGRPTGPGGAQPPGGGTTAGPVDDGEPGLAPAGPGVSPPAGGVPTTTTPAPEPEEPTATTTAPTADPPAEERTLTSSGGSVRATCTSASTAKLVSWSATKPFKVNDVDAGPGSNAVAEFKHGNRLVRMTVTCSDGVPSSSNDES